MSTILLMPALAAYAAREAEVLPVEAQITQDTPNSRAFETPTVMPLSLNEPVGFSPSFFTCRVLSPKNAASLSHLWRPVPPSLSVILVAPSLNGRNG